MSGRRFIVTVLILLSVAACGQGGISLQKQNDTSDPRLTSGIDPLLKPYVELFERYYNTKVTDIPVNFKAIPTAGECRKYHSGHREIFIDPSIANIVKTPEGLPLPEDQRQKLFEQAVLHELGHCALDRNHEEERLMISATGTSIPRSIMHPHYFGHQNFYMNYHDYYLKELFHPESITEIPPELITIPTPK